MLASNILVKQLALVRAHVSCMFLKWLSGQQSDSFHTNKLLTLCRVLNMRSIRKVFGDVLGLFKYLQSSWSLLTVPIFKVVRWHVDALMQSVAKIQRFACEKR